MRSSSRKTKTDGLLENKCHHYSSALMEITSHLSELHDASTARVDGMDDLNGLVLPALGQLLHLDPNLGWRLSCYCVD